SGSVPTPTTGILSGYTITADVTGTAALAIADPSVPAAPRHTKTAGRPTARNIGYAAFLGPGRYDSN
ncbi:hypothetical protein D8666_19735, partial [Ochrobactrum soli]